MKAKLCMTANIGFPISESDMIYKIRDAGFDGFFTGWWGKCDPKAWAEAGRKAGMFYQSIHAPFGDIHKMWIAGEEGDECENYLYRCLDACSELEVPVMIAHAIIGFDRHEPNEIGAERFARLGERARSRGVTVALENTEGEEYLAVAMEATKGNPYVGFCLDTGHEMCYNRSKDMLALYGDRLVATHLNDNMGVTGDRITFLDDAHMIPYDGIGDWEWIVSRFDAHGYTGPYTFELKLDNHEGRHTNDRYADWTVEKYLAVAYERAVRIRSLSKIANG